MAFAIRCCALTFSGPTTVTTLTGGCCNLALPRRGSHLWFIQTGRCDILGQPDLHSSLVPAHARVKVVLYLPRPPIPDPNLRVELPCLAQPTSQPQTCSPVGTMAHQSFPKFPHKGPLPDQISHILVVLGSYTTICPCCASFCMS